ncbi:transposon ty3-I gag-pol polyprotein, partial [Tanacetum coccineum]
TIHGYSSWLLFTVTIHRAQLQASLGQLQGRPGGNGDQGSLLPRSICLDVPKFTGEDPEKWLFAITEYFSLLNTPADQRLRIVGFNLEGAATEWFQWMSRNGLITDWKRFKESVMDLVKPTTLGDAFSLVRVTEARLDDQAASLLVTVTKAVTSSRGQCQTDPHIRVSSNQETVAKPTLLKESIQTTTNTNPKPPLAIKRISSAKCQERLNKGLCYNCDNKWVRGHKCLGKFLLLMTDDEDDTVQDLKEDVVEIGNISILNSLIGQGVPRSLQLWGTIGSGIVHVLTDKGSTHNFVRPDVVEKICLPVQSSKPFKVYIGSGETLLCESICSRVTLSMQGLIMEVDLYVLPRKGPDIVLGRDYALKGEEQAVNLPKDEHEGQPMEQPLSGRPPEEVTREWLSEFQEAYPSYHLEDKVIYEGEKNVTPSPRKPRQSKRARSKPAWLKDYAM